MPTTMTTYSYDKAHNRTQKVKDGVTTGYSYNGLNQMTGFTEGNREVSFDYDDNGNRVSRTEGAVVDAYAYDYENRLVSLQKGSVAYAYTYDYRTRRVERVEGSTTTKIVFSGGTSVQEYVGDNRRVEYIRGSDYGGGIGGILYTLRNNQPSYTHYNNRGDVVAKTDGDQAVTYQASYEAFGTRTQEVGQTQDRQKANTKDEDPTGLLNEGFRYRDLETGSFITRDPLGFKAGPNFYTYVHQNPWTKFDPEGLESEDAKNKRPRPEIHIQYGSAQYIQQQVTKYNKELQSRTGLPVAASAQFYINYNSALQHTAKAGSEASFSFTPTATMTLGVPASQAATHVNKAPAIDPPEQAYAKSQKAIQMGLDTHHATPLPKGQAAAMEKGVKAGSANTQGNEVGLFLGVNSGMIGYAHTHTESGIAGLSPSPNDHLKLRNMSSLEGNKTTYGFLAAPAKDGTARLYMYSSQDPTLRPTGIVMHYR